MYFSIKNSRYQVQIKYSIAIPTLPSINQLFAPCLTQSANSFRRPLTSKNPLRSSSPRNGFPFPSPGSLRSSFSTLPAHTLHRMGFRAGAASTTPMQTINMDTSSSRMMSRGGCAVGDALAVERLACVLCREECSCAE